MPTEMAGSTAHGAETVSVIIATHQRAVLLRSAIESVQRQSLPPMEIIVADDGATLPPDFAQADADAAVPVRYLALPKSGMCASRRAGYAASRGDLLMFLDDDDELEQDAVARLYALFARDAGTLVTVGSADVVDAAGNRTGDRYSVPESVRQEELWTGNRIINAGTALIRRAAYDAVGGWNTDSPNAADYLLWLKLVRIGRIVGTGDVVLRYREHAANESSKGNQFLHLVAFRRAFRRACPEHARTAVEDSVLAGIVRNHAEATYWHMRQLIRASRWREASSRVGRLAAATLLATAGPQTRTELAATFVRLLPHWLRR